MTQRDAGEIGKMVPHHQGDSTMRSAVLGAGSWGTALGAMLASKGFTVMLWDKDVPVLEDVAQRQDRKSTRLNSSHGYISQAVFCFQKQREPEPQFRHAGRLEDHGARVLLTTPA